MKKVVNGTKSFYIWILEQKSRKDEVGRLSQEISKDKTFPKNVRHLYLYLHYYDSEPINRKIIKEAHAEWRRLNGLQNYLADQSYAS